MSSIIFTYPSIFLHVYLFIHISICLQINQGFGSAFFFADPDPGKNLHADLNPVPDPDPGGIWGRGLGVKGKNEFFF